MTETTSPKTNTENSGRWSFQRLWNWGRLLLGGIGLLLVVYTVSEEDALIKTLVNVNLALIIPSFVLIIISTVIKTGRWMVVLNQSDIDIKFRRLLGTYFVGAFFSQFMPGASAGGDAMRMVEMSADSGRAVDSVSSVLVERAMGIATILFSASLILLIAPQKELMSEAPLVIYVIHGLTFMAVAGLIVLRFGWFVDWGVNLLTKIRLGKIGKKIQSLSETLQDQLGSTKIVLQMVGLSFLANAFSMTATYIMLLAFDNHVLYFSFIPIIALTIALEAIPISPGAIGVREGLYVYFLGFLGVAEGAALGTALMLRVVTWLQAGIGGIILIVRSFSPAVEPLPSVPTPPSSPIQLPK